MTSTAVTGVTGQLGGRVARRLADAGVPQRLIARDPSRAPALDRAVPARAAYGDGETCRRVLRDIDTLFMVSASESPHRLEEHRTFVDAATSAGVRHIVYTSFYGASPKATFTLARDHHATEEYIRASGLPYTFLRDNVYADFLPRLVADDGTIRGPAGDGQVAAVAQDDIADAATAVLRDPSAHVGATYDLTGPESLTFDDIAAIITDATGTKVTYHAETVDEAYASRSSYGAPPWQLDAWVSTYTAIAAGELATVTDAVERLTGRPATSLAELLRAAT
jgi:NAD(P)H dehydrogenase (quinone)